VPPSRAQRANLVTLVGSSFSRSYGCNLPSSLTIVLPIALVFSTRPPVSVWGTGAMPTRCWAFLDSMESMTSSEATRHHVSEFMAPTLIGTLLHAYPRTTIAWVHLSFCVPLQLSATNAMGSPEGSPHVVDLGPGADTAVLEYQPVVHRLRLAASP
jgi:hypothetical protein